MCAPREDSIQPEQPPSLIRVFAVHIKKHWVLSYPLSAQWRLIRLGGCPGWSDSSLGAQSFFFFFFFHEAAHIHNFKHLLRNHWANQSNFIWSFYWLEERKFVQMVLVTWSRWLPCPYMVKAFKNLHLWNQKADDLETWYAGLGTRVLRSLFKWWPWVDLDLFYTNGPGHMTNMATMPMNGKNLKKNLLLLWNQEADDPVTQIQYFQTSFPQ